MLELHPHQEAAMKQLKNGNILWGSVGTGKSRVAIEYYKKNESDKDIFVITTAKKRDSKDWEGEAARIGLGIMPGHSSLYGHLTVDSWNNLHKYKDVKDAFFVF